jgi:succinyl-CoA synthetase alpha subunit
MGGDIVAGTNLVDALRVFEKDDETEGIILIGEVGGRAEEDAAEWIKDYRRRVSNPKPIAALVGGKEAKVGRIMGHAGAWAARGEATAEEKYKYLENAGAVMVDHPEMFGGVMKTLLKQSGRHVDKFQANASQQTRGFHTLRRFNSHMRIPHLTSGPTSNQQRRTLFLRPDVASSLLNEEISQIKGLKVVDGESPDNGHYLGIIVDRTERSPCIVAAPTPQQALIDKRVKRFPYDWSHGPPDALIAQAIDHMQLTSAPLTAKSQATKLVANLAKMYKEKEAIILSGCVSVDDSGNLNIHSSSLTLMVDDSAFRSAKRQQSIHALREKTQENQSEVDAEQDGIVYVELDDAQANIGTLVNGAGLAMNTLDALRLHGGRATNFLDTGGKATSATVKKSFEIILRDPRVKVIFVNIFGGLTDGGMIAEGILLAFKEVDMKNVPVVVRIRGTNEETGQKIIAESGLGLDAFDKFEEAAKRVIEIANKH